MKKNKNGTNPGDELSIKNEIIGIGLLFSALFLIFSLISYTPLDPSFFHSTVTSHVANFGGRIGSEVAAVLFNLFGYSSYILIFFFLFCTAFFFFNRRLPNALTKTFGFVLLILSSAAFLAGVWAEGRIDGAAVKTGGIFGYFLNHLVAGQIKPLFSGIFFLCLILVSLVLIAKISARRLFTALLQLALTGFAWLRARIGEYMEEMQKNRRMRKIRQKYDEAPSAVAPPEKEKPREREKERGRETEREREKEREPEPQARLFPEPRPEKEKKPAMREPSRGPEDTFLFAEMEPEAVKSGGYQPPPITYLDAPSERSKIDHGELEEKKDELALRLQEFRINGKIVEYAPGPLITTFEFVPDTGVKVKDVASLTEDLALVVKAQYVRIERILGKKAIGIEIPNKKREIIHLRELLESPQYRNSSSPLTIALGKTATGEIFISDLKDMPHLLVAGATGSGKSVCIHTILLSILYKSSPKEVKFILIDPKRIEMAIYNSLPHLLTPVVVNPKLAKNALDWAVFEMENRYKKLATLQVRNIEQYNKKLELMVQSEDEDLLNLEDQEKLHYIVIVIDELADLMMTSAREIEDDIARLAQKARAVGIHLILATQRPSIDVITGTIKNNFPSRIALAVPSKHDSRTIIDQMGAEKLLGNGDMLFLPPKTASLIRLHCSYVSEEEAVRVVNYLSKIEKPEFNTQIIKQSVKKDERGGGEGDDQGLDDLFFEAAETVITTGQASASYLQRKMSVGYARAGRLIDQLQEHGVVSPPNSKNQREILLTLETLEELRKELLEGEETD